MFRKNRLLALVVLVLFAAAVVAGCGGGGTDSPAGDVVKIGFLGGTTGGHAAYGIETLKGMKMAAQDINDAGGILGGKMIQIVEEDHGSKDDQAASVTQKMITQGVAAIIGDPTTGFTKLAAPICQGAGVVLMSAGAVGDGVMEPGDYIYRNTLLDKVGAPLVTGYLADELGWKKVVLVSSTNNDYSAGQSKIFRKSLAEHGVEIVMEQSIQDGDQNFSAQVTAMSRVDFDGIVFTGYYTEGGLFMKEMRKQGLDQVLVGGDGLLAPVLWELGEEATEGSMVYTGFAADPANAGPKTAAFIEAYRAANNDKLPDMFSAQGYDAVMLVVDAMVAAESTDPAVFKETLKQTADWQGVTGTITFGADREPIKSPVYLLEVKNQEFAVKAAIDR